MHANASSIRVVWPVHMIFKLKRGCRKPKGSRHPAWQNHLVIFFSKSSEYGSVGSVHPKAPLVKTPRLGSGMIVEVDFGPKDWEVDSHDLGRIEALSQEC